MQTTPYEIFYFEDYVFDKADKTLRLTYSLDGKISFEETIRFDFEYAPAIDPDVLRAACFGLFITAGISYLKAFLPPKIILRNAILDHGQKKFFEKLYLNGLGQFFFENHIDPQRSPSFPVVEMAAMPGKPIDGLAGSLVAFGGGKDSIVTCEILKQAGVDFETWNVGDYPFFGPALAEVGKPHQRIVRTISSKLAEVNRAGAYNGHVPITATNSFIGICAAILRGRKNVTFSNESSSREGNVEYQGMLINHQYSKTLEFERDFQDYIGRYVSPSLAYFSFLRPLSELSISEIFCKNFFAIYSGKFSSCNRNFTIDNPHTKLFWCGSCAKCASVFALFSPFLSRDTLVGLFSGKDLFADPGLRKTYEGLLGISGIKPFDCVGEVMEMRKAVMLAKKTSEWPALANFSFEDPSFDYKVFEDHAMPHDFAVVLGDFLKQ